MRHHALFVPLVIAALAVAALGAQTAGSDEAAIRAAIAELPRTDRYTADSIFFSGAYRRPYVRGESKPEPTTRAQAIVAGSDQTTVRVRRIEIASAGDMAYEFTDGTVSRRLKRAGGEEPETFDNSTLRVWKKVNGQWRVAAHFSARHEDRQ